MSEQLKKMTLAEFADQLMRATVYMKEAEPDTMPTVSVLGNCIMVEGNFVRVQIRTENFG